MHVNFKGFYIVLLLVVIVFVIKYMVPYWHHWKWHSQAKDLYQHLNQSQIPWKVIGNSEKNRPIYLYETGRGQDTVLIMGVFHGDEPVGANLVVQLADTLFKRPSLIKEHVVLLPVVNPDGLMKGKRTNADGVDINRNFPTTDWSPVYIKKRYFPGREAASEKETQIVMMLIDHYKPDRIISIHADLRMNNFNGPAERLAKVMAKDNGYPVTSDVGYSTPGSFGTYAGMELKIPVITLELPDIGPEKAWQQNFKALLDAINFKE